MFDVSELVSCFSDLSYLLPSVEKFLYSRYSVLFSSEMPALYPIQSSVPVAVPLSFTLYSPGSVIVFRVLSSVHPRASFSLIESPCGTGEMAFAMADMK